MHRGQELACLHTAQDGQHWSVNESGNPQLYPYPTIPSLVRSGTYLVLGCPENYSLITKLYTTLRQKKDKSRLLVGAPTLCRGRDSDIGQVLSCLSTLNVHASLVNCWHDVGSKAFNTYLLLQCYREGGINDLISTIFKQNCLHSCFDFMGLTSLRLVVQLMDEIVDPRWFLNPRRPYSFSRIESYFGLKPAQFRSVCSPDLLLFSSDRQRRSLLLWAITEALPADSFVVTESAHIEDDNSRRVAMCRQVLGFVVRNWLTELRLPGYFDPEKFFKQEVNLFAYWRQFKE